MQFGLEESYPQPVRKIDVLIVDSDYGFKEEDWDQVAWNNEFDQAINIVLNPNGSFEDYFLLFPLTDKQFVPAITLVEIHQLNHRVVVWSKGSSGVHITGARFRTTTEYIHIAWLGSTQKDYLPIRRGGPGPLQHAAKLSLDENSGRNQTEVPQTSIISQLR